MNAKRKKIQNMIYDTISILDKSGKNLEAYKKFFDSMSDEEFNKYMKRFLNDPEEHFYMEIIPFQNEPTLKDIKKAADYLGVPLEEYVYFRHDGNKNNPVRTKYPVPVGYLHLKRLQQILTKKNSMTIDIDRRNPKTGQVTGDSKIGRLSDAENYALTVMGADFALQEFMGPRADDANKKNQMYQRITTDGYVQLNTLSSDIEDSQTLNTVDVFFTGAGIITDLLSPGLALPRTLKNRKKRTMTHEKRETLD